MVISQARVSPTLEKHFGKEFRSKWKLEKYSNPNKPAVFLGLYKNEDLEAFMSHKSFRIFILGGSDMTQSTLSRLQGVMNDGRTFTWMYPGKISNILSQNNIPHKQLYIPLKDYSQFKPVPLGDKIYVYRGAIRQNPSYYKWKEIVEPLMSHFGKNRILFTQGQNVQSLVKNVYPQSFVYIKPNEKGGNTTMWEVGHMGIKTLGKGQQTLPNFTEYTDLSNLVSLIEAEEKYIGTTRTDVADGLNKIFKGPEWLDLSFWK